ncbi:MAG TPA: putative lipid II flippase FtsW [Syntrophomonadaceae bacterium]|nr:putative lipid II flippase FtsW [Syntrophomonadaceae bacterium]HQA06830.1 putative lipid II flippase FtsW [Syntrophomonadaceae bacterium]HQE22762.1 putative lipid II flippase FtsW [Syntrophomonadaceae bacterium]
MRLRKGPPDFILFITTLLLVGIGLVMVFSSSAVTSNIWYDDAYFYFKRQLIWALIGIVCMLVVMKLNYLRIKDMAIPLMIVALLCLILVVTPLGIEAKGATRSLGVGFLRFSPSELAKIAMVMFLAKVMEVNLDSMRSFVKGIIPYLILIALVCGLIMLQPDLGTAFAIAGTAFFMMLAAGARWSHLGVIAVSGAGLVAAAIAVAPYRLERFIAFLNPWKYPTDEGFQTIQSLYALGSGGLFGMGLGRSRQKFFYLPEQHTDFIFAILGEELGFLGAFLVICLFLLFAWRGFKIALNAPDTFSSLLATGLTVMVVFQAAINIGVVSGALPVTGITLPFISYGGSSLLFSMIGVGLLLNISRYSTYR